MTRVNVAADAVRLTQGRFHCSAKPGRELTYGELASTVDLDVPANGSATPKPCQSRELTGTSAGRLDLETKLFGSGFVHDLELPGMLHGRVVRPPSYSSRLCSRRGIVSSPVRCPSRAIFPRRKAVAASATRSRCM